MLIDTPKYEGVTGAEEKKEEKEKPWTPETASEFMKNLQV